MLNEKEDIEDENKGLVITMIILLTIHSGYINSNIMLRE